MTEQAERDAVAVRAFLAPESPTVGGITLRPVTLATLTLLTVTKNEFIQPRGPLKLDPETKTERPSIENELFAALAFAYIHGAPVEEVRRIVWSDTLFRDRVIEFGDKLSPASIGHLVAEIERSLATINALRVATQDKPKEDSSGPTPPPN